MNNIMTPQIGQRWRFINEQWNIDYIGELIAPNGKFFDYKIVQVFQNGKGSFPTKVVGNVSRTLRLTIDGPTIGSYGETWHYLPGQDKSE
jgi:hypothetical protein